MGDEMQDGDAGIAGADGDEHEAEVRRGGSRQELFGMIPQQRHEAAGDRSRQADRDDSAGKGWGMAQHGMRSEEHTSELQSLMRISYAVFCLKKKTTSTLCRSRMT